MDLAERELKIGEDDRWNVTGGSRLPCSPNPARRRKGRRLCLCTQEIANASSSLCTERRRIRGTIHGRAHAVSYPNRKRCASGPNWTGALRDSNLYPS